MFASAAKQDGARVEISGWWGTLRGEYRVASSKLVDARRPQN